MKRLYIIISILFCAILANAQSRFIYLTTDEARIDSLLPSIGYRMDLPENYSDSVYTVSLVYPEYVDMSPADIRQYNHLSGEALPEIPHPSYSVSFERKKPFLNISVQPLAFRDGKYKWLASFMLKIEAKPTTMKKAAKSGELQDYASHSVLATGKWAKIRVDDTGIFELTESVIKKAGFTDINKVKIYGYGGNRQPEAISKSYLLSTDDLQEVAQCVSGGRHLFFAKGPVSWNTNKTTERIRNQYSDYGYYFITQGDDTPMTISESDLCRIADSDYSSYHSLYENDAFAWYHGGRNLYDGTAIEAGSSKTYTIDNPGKGNAGNIAVTISSPVASTASIECNDSTLGNVKVTISTYQKANIKSKSSRVVNLGESNKIKIKVTEGGPVRVDYISAVFDVPRRYDLSQNFPAASYVYNITNQDHHADAQADMVIIVPTSQKLMTQAKRLANFHAEHDGMRVNVVPADELYNEFSSGTPDANAYRRYLKMLYDRAETDADAPKYLLLFGDGVWDNRFLLPTLRTKNPDDYLLCFESENSYSEVDCYVNDGWYCLLDEGEGINPQSADIEDVAVGRIPATTAVEAKNIVDKCINYMTNENAGAWQNVLVFMGDDGNNNLHMNAQIVVSDSINTEYPGYMIKNIMWDTYEMVSSSSGNTYPEITKTVIQQQQDGALIMDYAGHGNAGQLSHETVLKRTDFESFKNTNLPLWITASCDVTPFDADEENIGEASLFNPNGGAIAFYGTTRTVYANYNKNINLAFLHNVLSTDENGKPMALGEAQRQAKSYLITSKKNNDRTNNKLHYVLLGDPAIPLNIPQSKVVIDYINDVSVNDEKLPQLKAGSVASIKGHIEGHPSLNGQVTAIVRDSEEKITCKMNEACDTAFVYTSRIKTLFNGSSTMQDGQFNLSFSVPVDINYSDALGQITMYAVSDDKKITAHGTTDHFIVGGSENSETDGTGPNIFCYLNTPSFVNGDNVNPTPYFVAEISDKDGINVSGSGVGHDLMLIIDGEMTRTYNLNENFSYSFGSYTNGRTFYSIPMLSPGEHTLKFRAWDIFNNSSTTELTFNVAESLKPEITSVSCTNNPASISTTFVVNHDRMGSDLDVVLEVMDMSGRLLWKHVDNGINGTGTYTYNWDLTQSNGSALQTGVYLYRVKIASDGSEYDSKAKKLIIVR